MPHPAASVVTPDRAAARARSACFAIGARAFGWETIGAAFGGRLDSAWVSGRALVLPYAGRNGMRHFHPGCPPTGKGKTPVADPSHTHTTLGRLRADLVPSLWHRCVYDFDAWIGSSDQLSLRLLADAHLLTAPWAHAHDERRRKGREVVPADSAPLTCGLLDELRASVTAAHEAAPDQCTAAGLATLARRLEEIITDWADLVGRREEIAAADPHRIVERWQYEMKLPLLVGTPRQVRWAERLRFNLFHNDPTADPDWFDGISDAVEWIIVRGEVAHQPDRLALFDTRPAQ